MISSQEVARNPWREAPTPLKIHDTAVSRPSESFFNAGWIYPASGGRTFVNTARLPDETQKAGVPSGITAGGSWVGVSGWNSCREFICRYWRGWNRFRNPLRLGSIGIPTPWYLLRKYPLDFFISGLIPPRRRAGRLYTVFSGESSFQ